VRQPRVSVTWAAWSPSWLGAEAWLDAAERTRLHASRSATEHHRRLLGAALPRVAVAARTGTAPGAVRIDRACADCGRQHGRPRVDGSDLDLSTSYAGGLMVVAVADSCRVGVDVEEVPDATAVADVTSWLSGRGAELAPDELAVLWARIEAVAKCDGVGLRADPRQIAVSAAREEPVLLAYPDRPALPHRMVLVDLDTAAGCRAALAVDTGTRPPTEPTMEVRTLRGPPPDTGRWAGTDDRRRRGHP
jgi:4'-phosphopantetheinyl transferase